MINIGKHSLMIPKTNKTIQAKAKAAKAGTDYVISEALCDFRSHEAKRKCCNLCAFRTHILSDFWVYTFRFLDNGKKK